jgi:NAD(P)-dependent dehydrogenase (short-subunit alcohol dehydrogenase family)
MQCGRGSVEGGGQRFDRVLRRQRQRRVLRRQRRQGAVTTLSRAWPAESGASGVRVNAISPGVIRTPDLDPSGQHPAEVMMRGTPAGRVRTPDAIAHAAVDVASDEAEFGPGTVIDVDGGRVGAAVVAV